MFSHAEARVFYDRFGSKQDLQRFYERGAVFDLIRHMDLGSVRSVLEFGGGTGWFAEYLLAHELPADARYLGVDISETMVKLARTRLERFGPRASVLLTEGEMQLNVEAESFDRFLSTYVTDLLSEEDIKSLIAEAHRVLTPNGLLGLVGLGKGFTFLTRAVEKIWSVAHRIRPALVGGCRPISLETFVKGPWNIRQLRTVGAFGVPSEVLVAEKV